MAKCIRCGKPCASGENMCDECKAWFQEKTVTIYGDVALQTIINNNYKYRMKRKGE